MGNTSAAIFASGSTIDSYGNNQIDDNAAAGATIPVIPLK
jgi:hypothetical protein